MASKKKASKTKSDAKGKKKVAAAKPKKPAAKPKKPAAKPKKPAPKPAAKPKKPAPAKKKPAPRPKKAAAKAKKPAAPARKPAPAPKKPAPAPKRAASAPKQPAAPKPRKPPVAAPASTVAVPTGRFVWHDLMTTDAEAAREFYAQLLGWKFEPIEAGGATAHLIRVGDRRIGAIMPESGIPTSHWIPYVSVADVDRTCASITSLGGNVGLSAMDVPGFGRFAVANDPTGAFFSPLTRETPELPAGMPTPGVFCWDELVTHDVEAAVDFYRELFGWTVDKQPSPEPYWLAKDGEAMICGLMPFPEDTGAKPFWLAYIAVADVDRSTGEVRDLGGMVHREPSDIPGIGRFAVVADPSGASFALFKGLPPA